MNPNPCMKIVYALLNAMNELPRGVFAAMFRVMLACVVFVFLCAAAAWWAARSVVRLAR